MWDLLAVVFPKHRGTLMSWTHWQGQHAQYCCPVGWGSTRWLSTKRGGRRGSNPMLQVHEMGIGSFPTCVSSAGNVVGPGEKQHGKINLWMRNLSSPVLKEVCPAVWPKSYFHADKFGQGPWYGPQNLWGASAKWGEEVAVVLRHVPESRQEVTATRKLPGRSSVLMNCPVIIAHTTVFWKEVFFSWAKDYWWSALMQPLKNINNTCK